MTKVFNKQIIMGDITIFIVIALSSLVAGLTVSWLLLKRTQNTKDTMFEEKAKAIIKDAEIEAELIKKNKIFKKPKKQNMEMLINTLFANIFILFRMI